MPSYKLTYFDVRARAELSRFVFLAAGKDFEDVRVTFENWPSVKPSTPFGQMPVLEVDGKKLAQSNAIARFLAREFDLAGKNNWEQGVVDQYLVLLEDLFKEDVKLFYEQEKDKKKQIQKNLSEVVYPKFLGIFEKALDAYGGEYLVGDSLTAADLAMHISLENALQMDTTLLNEYPKLKALRSRVEAIPKISEYVKNRKQTDI